MNAAKLAAANKLDEDIEALQEIRLSWQSKQPSHWLSLRAWEEIRALALADLDAQLAKLKQQFEAL